MEVNTTADKHEAILRELKTNTTAFEVMREENKALTTLVNELKSCPYPGHDSRGARDS